MQDQADDRPGSAVQSSASGDAATLAGRTLQVRGLTKDYATAAEVVHVLRGVDLTLNGGEALAVTGPSGSGKSTLLYILGAIEEPTSGTVRIDDVDPFSLNEAERAAFRNRHIGFVFQDHHLLPQLTVLENVLVPLLAGPGVDEAAEARARQLLKRVGLEHRVEHRPAEISGGERQRVAVCRAMINQPTLLLADEPTGNLDPSNSAAIGDLLLEVAAEQSAILICVTHNMELAARFPQHKQLREGRLHDA
ncbi:MAG: ABC transporter ATP-binding protein [Planctomycetota bacterium]|nr:MAG: ABC transporter ATP-binding protein [Planctomycetota bacterium]